MNKLLTFVVALQALLLILNVTGVTNVSWWLIFIPLEIVIAVIMYSVIFIAKHLGL